MELTNFTDVAVQVTEEEAAPTDFSIDEESLGILFKGFSDGLYSNKIGSIVREITSNCFDSHVEAGITRPVTIEMTSPDAYTASPGSISFIDFGMGLSPDRIKNIYSKYFASTKRLSNAQIGGFGIGAKSPLSYTESFMAITRFEGIEYVYIIHRGLKVPQIQMVEHNPTEKHNGTEIKIPIKNRSDFDTFQKEIKAQLTFFDNINYVNCNMDNNYKLYQGKHFIIRYDKDLVARKDDRLAPSICLGKVKYPIDWYQCDYNDRTDYNSAISLRFDIGDITVTMNRESIEYTDAVKKKITQKFKDATLELQTISDGNREIIDDFSKYLELCKNDTDLLKLDKDTFVSATGFIKSNPVQFADFVDLHKNFKFPASDPFFQFEIPGLVTESGAFIKGVGNSRHPKTFKYQDLVLKNTPIYRINTAVSKRKNLYLHSLDGNFFLLRKRPEIDAEAIARTIGMGSQPDTEKELVSQVFTQAIIKYLVSTSKSYDRTDIDPEWLKEYLLEMKSNCHTDKFKVEFLYQRLYGGYGGDSCRYDVQKGTFAEFIKKLNHDQVVIYGGTEDVDKLTQIFITLANIKKISDGSNLDSQKIMVLKLSKESIKIIKTFPGAMHINDAAERFHKHMTTIKLAKEFLALFPDTNIYERFLQFNFPKIAAIYLDVSKQTVQKLNGHYLDNHITTRTINSVIATYGYHPSTIETQSNIALLKKWYDSAPFGYLNHDKIFKTEGDTKPIIKNQLRQIANINFKSLLNY